MTKSALLMKMVEVLRSRPGILVSELARVVNRSERTVYRWLGELSSDLNTPVYCKDGGYFIGDADDRHSLGLNHQELLALRLSLKAGPFGPDSPIKDFADSAWLKI